MTRNQTEINARVARALIRAMGYQALNAHRNQRGETIAYTDEAFEKLIDDEGIGYNDVASLLNDDPGS